MSGGAIAAVVVTFAFALGVYVGMTLPDLVR